MARSARALSTALIGLTFAAAGAFAQGNNERGRLEIVVRVTPASGRAEPARSLTVYLLTKGYRDIQHEAEEDTPRPDLNAFVDGLKLSPDLRAWMKKNHTVAISGDEFRNRVTPDDLFRVPEFLDAYVNSNMSGLNQGFPEPKYSSEDRTANPQKYEANRKAYEVKLRKYLAQYPDSKEGMDTILAQIDPSTAWSTENAHWHERTHARALELVQRDYLAAKTDTDLEGRGAFEAAPGAYWLSTLDGEALSGELHLRWNVTVEVHPGTVSRIELTNLNADKKR